MTPSPTDISVVICAYRLARWDSLCETIDSVRSQTVPAGQVILVSDHDAALFRRARKRFVGVRVVPNAGEPGLSAARNAGLAQATGDVVAFIDDDAAADPRWLERLAAVYADPRVLGAGGRIEPAWDGERPRWWPEEFDWVFGCSYRGMPDGISRVRNMIGANMSFRRDVLAGIGGFRTDLGRTASRPAGAEETDACIRATQLHPDGVILHEPAAAVAHHVPDDRTTWRYFRSRCFHEGLSKAALSRSVGTADGLSSERAHVLRTLPRGVAEGFGDTLLRRDPWGVPRAGAIVAGLAVTVAGYTLGRLGGPAADT